MDPEAQKLVELLAQQEAELSLLYHGYSSQFPDADFWSTLSKEESIHKDWVLTLQRIPDISIDKNHFQLPALVTMIEYIQKRKNEQKRHNLIQALSISLDIEKALLEKEYFKIYKTDSPDVQRVFAALEKATKEHVRRVEEELNRVKVEQNIQ